MADPNRIDTAERALSTALARADSTMRMLMDVTTDHPESPAWVDFMANELERLQTAGQELLEALNAARR